ncbi:uncharacterized protein A1O9_07984 [Exophiala aquamarina CBS 119918]|uniref:PIPK domain-containing protein n=1 Tax=Exophiala aquamarina CBS 119918 TaxID=1182545 RepID=A0A072PAV7_9EURO|nr:uncharacterized protein A1O9_07984 [Exophiala aquamarina CBS 119918]KEF56403.1 hypothetical protein A1O9_07984 [Exophiala aquamarina CBS 119918]
MDGREKIISRSIVSAIQDDQPQPKSTLRRILRSIRIFFYIYSLVLAKYRPELFQNLRDNIWDIVDAEYQSSFDTADALKAKGDMGYSGSTFFNTKDDKYLIKSIPRIFEHSFFRDDLLRPYVSHMESNPGSLLVRITDFLGWYFKSLGGILGLAPTYHLVMENLSHGQSESSDWETFDLKPNSYFFPERDIAGGRLASEATKSKLADKFGDKILLSREAADSFFSQLEKDTELLERYNAVDYSLMLVRIPKSSQAIPSKNPFEDSQTWRTGISSQDNKYIFRATVLDFFWAKHKVHAKMMTLLIKAWNLIDRQGHMSITTSPGEYRSRFMNMCRGIVEVREDMSGEAEAAA